MIAVTAGLAAVSVTTAPANARTATRPSVLLSNGATTAAALLHSDGVRVRLASRHTARLRLTATFTGAGPDGPVSIAEPRSAALRPRRARTVRVVLNRAGRRALGACRTGTLTVTVLQDRGTRRGPRRLAVRTRRLTAGATCTAAATPAPTKVADGRRCDPTDPAVCVQPFPSDRFTVPDASAATGRRVHFTIGEMPRNLLGVPVDPREQNRNDGFSPGSELITRVPGLDSDAALARTGAVPIDDLARAYDRSQPIVVIDADSGARWPVWSEVDVNPSDPAQRNLLIRPARDVLDGHRYIVALRRLRGADGRLLPASPAFRALREGTPTSDPALEARRGHVEALLGDLAQAGVTRDDLHLAWDFTVASAQNLTGRMLTIRNDAFAQLGDHDLSDLTVQGRSPAYTVDNVTENPGGADGPILRRVEGRVTVPCYMTLPGCPSGSRLHYDSGSDRPTQIPGNTTQARFTCQIPRRALDGRPLRAGIYGHGLLGDRGEVGQGQLQDLSQSEGFAFCATDWIGMSCSDVPDVPPSPDSIAGILGDLAAGRAPKLPDCDLPNIATILLDVSNFPTLVDRVQQGMLNFLYLGRAMIHPDGLGSDPAFQVNGRSVLDPTRLYYDGNSQGGIIGGALVAVAPDLDRAVLGVPGMNYSLLLRRSKDFDSYAQILYRAYPDELERPLVLSLMQMLWDRGEADGYAQHMTADPLPGTPAHAVLMHVGLGDHQVSPYAAKVEARTIGARAHVPWTDPGRDTDRDPTFGLKPLGPGPYVGSAIVPWDIGPLRVQDGQVEGTPPPPKGELPPSSGRDPHEAPRRSSLAMRQKSAFLRPGGTVIDVCGGRPCYAGVWHGPGGGR